MTDNEIIKALSTVTYGGHSCTKCKYEISKGEESCGIKGCNIARNALDLINRQKAEIEKLHEELLGCNPNADHPFGYKNISELKNKCGSCVYGKPSTFGKGFCYVECTNQEHIAKYCKRPISRIRQRTAPACRSYEDKTEKGGGKE